VVMTIIMVALAPSYLQVQHLLHFALHCVIAVTRWRLDVVVADVWVLTAAAPYLGVVQPSRCSTVAMGEYCTWSSPHTSCLLNSRAAGCWLLICRYKML
jgi:hypothetical protein